ncbi:MAG TPA: hypothetical protein VJ464_01965, partial [Blastocatellia bacterium]|nr:hypothetical protein [Blastocatellia bacterium]
MRKFRDYAILPWLVSIATLVGAYSASDTISPRVPRLILLAIGSGVLFIWIGLWLRHRYGVWPLAAWTAAAMAFGSLALGPITVDALDLPSGWGAWAGSIHSRRSSPMAAIASPGCAAYLRHAAAMFVTPSTLINVIAAFLNA